jgi:carbonic anhydrase
MKALCSPGSLDGMPNVAAWLRHSHAAQKVAEDAYPDVSGTDRVRVLALENVVGQLAHLRTHPSVASAIARGEMALHGWYVDIHAGEVLALDGETERFLPLAADRPLPVALQAASRRAADVLEAAE